MNFLTQLLGGGLESSGGKTLAKELVEILGWYVFPAILGLLIFWAIWIGWQFGSAKDEGTRTQAKNRFIKALATIGIVAVLTIILAWLGGTDLGSTPKEEEPEEPEPAVFLIDNPTKMP